MHRDRQEHFNFLSSNKYPKKRSDDRSMTDPCFFYFYMCLSILIISFFFYSFITKQQNNLFTPQDPNGRICGQQQAFYYPYIYFASPFTDSLNKAVCIDKCPLGDEQQLNCLYNNLVQSCKYDVTDHFNHSNQFIIYETTNTNILSLCSPTHKIFKQILSSMINIENVALQFQNLYQSRWIIIIICPSICLLLIIIYMLGIKFTSEIYYFYLFIIISSTIMIIYLCIKMITFGNYGLLYGILKIIGFTILLFWCIFLISLFFLRQNFLRSIKLLNISIIFISNNPQIIFLSLIFFILWIISIAIWLFIYAFIYSISYQSNHQVYIFPYLFTIYHSNLIKSMLWIMAIHFIWTNFIIYQIFIYLTQSCACNWTLGFTYDFQVPLYQAFRYHIGSIMLGAILITSFSWLTNFFYFIMPSQGYFLCCWIPNCKCFYEGKYFQNYLGLLTEKTYIYMNLNGTNFCESGKQIVPDLVSSITLINKAYRFAKLLILMSKLLIAFLTTCLCLLIIKLTHIHIHGLIIIITSIVALTLTGFATESYQHTFESIIISALIDHKRIIQQQKQKQQQQYRNNIIIKNKNIKIYEIIMQWFELQKQIQYNKFEQFKKKKQFKKQQQQQQQK